MNKQQAKPEHKPYAWLPGERFFWEDELPLTRREQVKLAIGIAVAAFVGILIVFAVSLA
jgi:hypothetical protein